MKKERSSEGRAFGKIIISGEHSVLFRQPAVVRTISSLITRVSFYSANGSFKEPQNLISSRKEKNFSFSTFLKHPVFKEQSAILEATKNSVEKSIKNFIMNCHQKFCSYFYQGKGEDIFVKIDSNIMPGCGLGSSAALGVALARAFSSWHRIPLSNQRIFQFVREMENQCHYNSSGVDVYAAMGNGLNYYKGEERGFLSSQLSIPFFAFQLGKTASSTAEVVEKVLEKDRPFSFWKNFGNITSNIIRSLMTGDLKQILKSVRMNQTLLEEISVVPTKTAALIKEIQKMHNNKISGKISGSGAINGDSGGTVIFFGQVKERLIEEIVRSFGFPFQKLDLERT